MKQFILLIAALLCLASSALATDITVSATTIPNTYFASVPGAASVVVNTSGTTVTRVSGINFNLNWPAGMLITINGTDYALASVTSSTSLTLGSSAGTQSSVTATIKPYVELRVYALQGFVASNGTIVPPGRPGEASWYLRRGVSITGGVANIPSIVIPSTTDAQSVVDRNARYFAGFYYPNGGYIREFDGLTAFQLPATPTTTTWVAIRQYNRPGTNTIQNLNAFTQAESDARYAQIGSVVTANPSTNVIPYKTGASSFGDSPLTVSGGNLTTGGSYTSTSYVQAALRDKGGQVFDIRAYGAVCDGSTSDQTAIDSAYAAAAAVHGVVFIPPSTSASPCMGRITISTYGVSVRGAGSQASFLKNTNTEAATITLDASAVNLHSVTIEGLALVGAGSGASNHGIYASGAALVNNLVVRDVNISAHGGRGVYDTASFTARYENMLVAQPAAASNAFEILGGNDLILKQTYVTTVGTNMAAYRIYSGSVSFIGVNGINSGTTADWAVLGRTVAEDGVDSYVQATFISTNIENFTNRGIRFKTGSFGNFFSTRITAPATGTVTPLSYQFVDNNSRGTFDAASAITTQGASYTNGKAVNSSGAPFVQLGHTDLTDYYDTAIGGNVTLPSITVALVAGSSNTAILLSRAKVTALEASGLVGDLTGATGFDGTASRVLLQNGAVGRPTLALSIAPTNGLYFDGSYQPAISVSGTQRAVFGATSTFTGTLSATVGVTTAGQLTSTVSTGTAPLAVSSTTVVPNLNVSQLLGATWAAPGTIGSTTPNTGAFTTISASGQITSTVSTGSAPLVVASTTKVSNLNADQIDGADFTAPGAIGGTTPGAGTFTTLTANTSLTVNGGTAVTKILSATATLDFASTGSGAVADLTITVPGAATGDTCIVGAPNGSVTATATFTCWISAADTATVRFSPKNTEDPASGTFRVAVIKF